MRFYFLQGKLTKYRLTTRETQRKEGAHAHEGGCCHGFGHN